MTISFIDLEAQQKRIGSGLAARIENVFKHGHYILGPEVEAFEKKLAEFIGVKHCIGVSSGTDALLSVLMALGIGPGDAVFTTPFTFIATAEVVSLLGATPIFVDIDRRTFNIDPKQLDLAIRAIESKNPDIHPLPAGYENLSAKAVIPVDLFGLPADYDPIMALAEQHSLFVLEDAAQGIGGNYHGKQAGRLGHAAATSFFPAKPLGCYGDGGAVLTDDGDMAERIMSIRVHGKGRDKYNNVRIGLNARLHTIQAAILLEKLEIFPEEVAARQRVADGYSKRLAEWPAVICPFVPELFQSGWAQYSVLVHDRDTLQKTLKGNGIPSAVYYGCPLHMQPAYSELGYQVGDMPVSEEISSKILSLPMHPYLQDETVAYIAEVISDAV